METRNAPAAKAEMLIRRPVAEVFEAFVDPAVTSKFWFSTGSARLEAGKQVVWDWRTFGLSFPISVKVLEPMRRIVIEWPGEESPTTVEWIFNSRSDGTTFVSITNTGFAGDDARVVEQIVGATEGFTLVLAGLKAFLEHNVILNLVADRFPDGLPRGA